MPAVSPSPTPRSARASACVRRAATRLLVLPLLVYRRVLSPLKPATCRFHPTCSQYAIEALERHGPLRGLALAGWRLLRCQPLCKGGYDPAPAARVASDEERPKAHGPAPSRPTA